MVFIKRKNIVQKRIENICCLKEQLKEEFGDMEKQKHKLVSLYHNLSVMETPIHNSGIEKMEVE